MEDQRGRRIRLSVRAGKNDCQRSSSYYQNNRYVVQEDNLKVDNKILSDMVDWLAQKDE